jgi:hypothetical protein
MSGLEVIGLVLAIWPLVVNGITIYKSVKSSQGWSLLLQEFRIEKTLYVEFVCRLLASDISEADLHQLGTGNKLNQALWEDESLKNSLRGRLGPEKLEIVVSALEEMNKILTSLTERFGVNKSLLVCLGLPQTIIQALSSNLYLNRRRRPTTAGFVKAFGT